MRQYLLSISVAVNFILSGSILFIDHQVSNLQVKVEKALDVEYVKGYEAALDCRGLMSAPLCEEVLKRAGQ